MKKLNLFAMALLFVGAVSCANNETAAEEAGDDMEQMADDAEDGMEDAADEMGDAAEEAGDEMEETMEGDGGAEASTEEVAPEAAM